MIIGKNNLLLTSCKQTAFSISEVGQRGSNQHLVENQVVSEIQSLVKGRRVCIAWATEDSGRKSHRLYLIAKEFAKSNCVAFFVSPNFLLQSQNGFSIKLVSGEAPFFSVNLCSHIPIDLNSAGKEEKKVVRESITQFISLLLRDATEIISIVEGYFWKDYALKIPKGICLFDCSEDILKSGSSSESIMKERNYFEHFDGVIFSSRQLAEEISNNVKKPWLVIEDIDIKEKLLYWGANALEIILSNVGINRKLLQSDPWKVYFDQVNELISLVKKTEPKISVIVVTYNNCNLTRECLASIENKSSYPNLELIVVDNNSTDDTREFLFSWSEGKPNVKCIFNDENRGFAAANNQGLEISSGEYIVLLNNDTVVTDGWLRTLRKHFETNSKLGILCPVTNNIGNEARVEVDYDTLDKMPNFATEYTYRHFGQIYPLYTAGFFCVMFKREVFQAVGYLDEVFGLGTFEDDDYCRRVQKIGLDIFCADDVFIHHCLSASFNKLDPKKKEILFNKNMKTYESRWGTWIPHSHVRTKESIYNVR
jgi:GT2 family glycosyltransferase